ncbi:phosphotransferase [Nonomuraea sp. NPDC050556]|uniref:phosphotransferase n=1 Tax=Nonomuraea sp. NPDC050556 TaxID=3364369 RepID=UPI00379DD443
MKDLPEGLEERDLRLALDAWGIGGELLEYAPVGFGDYHWRAGGRWFVTVADLERRLQPEAELVRAMDTAAALGDLEFVVPPLPSARGAAVEVCGRFGVSVFPLLDGVSGGFGDELDDLRRGQVLDVLAALHTAVPPSGTPVRSADLTTRASLEAMLADYRGASGPYGEAARDLVERCAPGIRRRLRDFDTLLAGLDGSPVVTHGEPHPGNVMWVSGAPRLVDWDTVGLAVPERDLWLVARGAEDLRRYAEASGREPDGDALELYRLRWALEDVSIYLDDFTRPHGDTADARAGWEALEGTVEELVTCEGSDASGNRRAGSR